jgi:hypothetical protein
MKPYRKCGIKKLLKQRMTLLADQSTVHASGGAAVRWSAPHPGAAPEGRHAYGRTIQLSQGQDRPPLRPEGAPPTAGVLRSQAALPLWWVGGIVHGAAAGVNSLLHFFRNGIHPCVNHLPSFLHSCKRATLTGLSGSVAYVSGRAMAVSLRNGLSETTALKLPQAFLSYKWHAVMEYE